VDVFPSLRNIPPGFPGGGFHALAAKWAKAFNDMVEVPYSYAKQMIVSAVGRVFLIFLIIFDSRLTGQHPCRS